MATSVSRGVATKRSVTARWLLGLLCVALGASCDCVGTRLVIVDPQQLASLGTNDDRDATLGGLQYDVVVDVTGLRAGEPITVYAGLDPETLVAEGVSFVGPNEPNGRATVRVTLEDGDVYLLACAGDACASRSPLRKVVVLGSLGTCPLVQFRAPLARGTDTLVLDAADNAATMDGTCGATYATQVRARVQVDDGTLVHLLVDGVPTAHATVMSRLVDFGAVTLGVRGTDTSTLRLVIDGVASSCPTDHPQPIQVGCTGPTCRLQAPVSGNYLNGELDARTDVAGLQVDLALESALVGLGRPFTLRNATSGALLATATATAANGQSRANFAEVALPEGSVRLAGQCSDGTLSTNAAVAEYAVDSVPCGVTLTSPTEGTVYTSADDLDGDLANSLQTQALLAVTGTECRGFRISPCAALTSNTFSTLMGALASRTITLGTSGAQTVCGQVRDLAGNLSMDSATVNVVPAGAPTVVIVSPAMGARINVAGGKYLGVTYTADRNPATTSCEFDVVVDCSAIGTPVRLTVDGSSSGVFQANCAANPTSTLGGRATFSSTSLPASAATQHTLVATQTVGSLVGSSASTAFGADCQPPTLTFASPVCGGVVRVADDVSTSPGIQRSVVVSSPLQPQVDVTLTVATNSGVSSTVTSLASMLPANAVSHTFSAVNFGRGGTARMAASAVDSFGNARVTSPCSVTVR